MKALNRSMRIVAGTLVVLVQVEALAQQSVQPQGSSQLKWTPHRVASNAPAAAPVASTPANPVAAPPLATPEPATPSAAATVTLPDGVPPVAAVAPRRPAAASRSAQARPRPAARGDWPSANRIAGPMQKAFDPANPDGLLGLNVMRAPQGEVARPMLAPEGRQALAMQRSAGRQVAAARGPERLGGGLAPRYAPRGRDERLAMNVDAIPSVMTQKPTVGGLDDTSVPGRVAPGTGAGESLPAPSAGPTPAPDAVTDDGLIIEGQTPEMGEGMMFDESPEGGMSGDDGLLMGEYPAELHVESFYDDPYECEDEECLPLCMHHGVICSWLRRFGKPYYGWRWYRDFTASAGITAFTNATDLGINGNFGTNEYLNWAMPFWNAFGIGWQVGWRGTQTNFQPSTIDTGSDLLRKNARDQNFVTTGFFTRAFEGRGLQGGVVYDYLSDSWFDNTDVSQIRSEISYVWGYHEAGFWAANNIGDQNGLFGPVTKQGGVASTLDLYCGFYRLQFGDANEVKVWGGGTGEGDGIVGSLVRAPMARSFAIEGAFTYVIPGRNQTIDIDGKGNLYTFSPAAWNVAVNLVYYPAGRSRRSLASPYRPLFEVADNGSMVRSIFPYVTP